MSEMSLVDDQLMGSLSGQEVKEKNDSFSWSQEIQFVDDMIRQGCL